MKSVGIVGGGVIGLCCAYYLQKGGYQVTVIDEGELNWGCSWLNAGMIVPSHIVPLAAPGMVAKGVRWMFSSESPFAIHMSKNKDLLHWLRLFYRYANKKHVEKSIPHLRDISLLSKSLYKALSCEVGFDFGYQEKGLLMLYQTEAIEKEERVTADYANAAGLTAKILTPGEIEGMEAEMPPAVRGGIYFPGDAHINPGKFVRDMIMHLKNNGVEFITNTPVTGMQHHDGRIKQLNTPKGNLVFDEYIIACGARSALLLKKINRSLPLQGGKGYSFTLDGLSENIHIPSLLLEGRVAVTPIEKNKLRVSGTMVIGEDNTSVSPKRVGGILHTLSQFYPKLGRISVEDARVSSGQRPCSPDGLPYIGRLRALDNLTVATGHGMMGMSLGPATGKLVSTLINGDKPDMDLDAFDVERFAPSAPLRARNAGRLSFK